MELKVIPTHRIEGIVLTLTEEEANELARYVRYNSSHSGARELEDGNTIDWMIYNALLEVGIKDED